MELRDALALLVARTPFESEQERRDVLAGLEPLVAACEAQSTRAARKAAPQRAARRTAK